MKAFTKYRGSFTGRMLATKVKKIDSSLRLKCFLMSKEQVALGLVVTPEKVIIISLLKAWVHSNFVIFIQKIIKNIPCGILTSLWDCDGCNEKEFYYSP